MGRADREWALHCSRYLHSPSNPNPNPLYCTVSPICETSNPNSNPNPYTDVPLLLFTLVTLTLTLGMHGHRSIQYRPLPSISGSQKNGLRRWSADLFRSISRQSRTVFLNPSRKRRRRPRRTGLWGLHCHFDGLRDSRLRAVHHLAYFLHSRWVLDGQHGGQKHECG